MNTIRIPRPIGTTELSRAYNVNNDEDKYQALIKSVIHHYIRNNFTYCMQSMNTEQFAKYINIPLSQLQRYMIEYGKELYKGQGEMLGKGNDLIRAIQVQAFFWGLEDRGLAMEQLSILKASQQQTYTPFVSGEVNKAIKLVMDSSAQMQSFIRLFGHQGTSTFVPTDPTDYDAENPTEKGVTVDDVVRLLKTENITPLKDNNEAQQQLLLEYNIENMPEVNALLQTNVDKSKEGLNIKEITKLNEAQLVLKDKSHINRRANELGKDLDDDEI